MKNKTKMAQKDLDYIRKNYLTLEQLSQRTALTSASILNLIDEKAIPAASYTIAESVEISSPLGDSVTHKTSTDYYAASTVQLLLSHSASVYFENAKSIFKAQFRNHLLLQPDRDYAYGNIFNDAGVLVEEEFEKAFEAEWEAYTMGIYGICTLNATEEEIVKKEIAVKKLIDFNNKSGLSKLIKASYSLLNLITYFTAGVKEVRAWTIGKGWKAPAAAGVIHTDFEKGFIRAEVIKLKDYQEYKTEAKIKEAGKMAVEGKDYVVQDGDIMHFRFNV